MFQITTVWVPWKIVSLFEAMKSCLAISAYGYCVLLLQSGTAVENALPDVGLFIFLIEFRVVGPLLLKSSSRVCVPEGTITPHSDLSAKAGGVLC